MSGKKSQAKKEKIKEVPKEAPTKSFFQCGKVLFFLSSVLAVLPAYYVYNVLTSYPELPKLDTEEYWGTLPVNPDRDLSIRPYKIEFSDVMVNDLKERLLHRRPFTPPMDHVGFTYGVNTNFLNQVMDYWQNKYNFKEREAFLNKFDQYITNIQGLDIHFIWVKPLVEEDVIVLPLLLLHGWPGSVREFYEVIPRLIQPRPNYQFVFEVIVPSLPGYGFSQAPARPGMGTTEMSVVMANLMARLGHSQYYVQGGDWGHALGAALSTLYPDRILGFHTNSPIVLHPLATVYTVLGSLWPSFLVEPELESRLYPLRKHYTWLLQESGYLHLQATKPDTIGVALTDSPSGLAAYILEKFSSWTNRGYRAANDGNILLKFSLTHLLDNIMIYWASNSITTSMRLYAETFSKSHMSWEIERIPTDVPTWGLKFKYELIFQPDAVLMLKYKNYIHTTAVQDGGHFAALENPVILASDIFEAVTAFRQFHGQQTQNHATKSVTEARTIYDFTVKDINGNDVKLDKYKGHVLVIVNVASQCGLTDINYKQFNELYEKYASTKGLRILAFPCNQFGGQEPGKPQDISKFAKDRGVKFDLFEKVDVNGDQAHPLWKFLKRTQSGTLGDFVKWNFSKFVIDKNGVPVERLGPNVNPVDLVPYLAKYW